MKRIDVVVQPFFLDEVIDTLATAGITGATARAVKSFGPNKGHTEWHRGIEYTLAFAPEVKIEFFVPDEKWLGAVETITATVNRHGRGNGSIVVSDCAEAPVPVAEPVGASF